MLVHKATPIGNMTAEDAEGYHNTLQNIEKRFEALTNSARLKLAGTPKEKVREACEALVGAEQVNFFTKLKAARDKVDGRRLTDTKNAISSLYNYLDRQTKKINPKKQKRFNLFAAALIVITGLKFLSSLLKQHTA